LHYCPIVFKHVIAWTQYEFKFEYFDIFRKCIHQIDIMNFHLKTRIFVFFSCIMSLFFFFFFFYIFRFNWSASVTVKSLVIFINTYLYFIMDVIVVFRMEYLITNYDIRRCSLMRPRRAYVKMIFICSCSLGTINFQLFHIPSTHSIHKLSEY